MSTDDRTPPKMMLGFVVRRCAAAVGHVPSAEELAAWANNYHHGDRTVCLFGRPISVGEARLILRSPGRAVSARSAVPPEQLHHGNALPQTNVVSLVTAAARLRRRSPKS